MLLSVKVLSSNFLPFNKYTVSWSIPLYAPQMDHLSRSTKYRYQRRSLAHYCAEIADSDGVPADAAGPPARAEPGDEAVRHEPMNPDELSDADDIYWDCEEGLSAWESSSESSGTSDEEQEAVQDCSEDGDGDTEQNSLQFKLAEWSVEYGISCSAVLALLAILNMYTPLSLPKHPMTLLRTPLLAKPVPMGDGEYHYFGLKAAIVDLFKKLPSLPPGQKLTLQINIDGIPLFRSSQTSLWPILGMIREICGEVIPIALFSGQKKPPLEPYLHDFVAECKTGEVIPIALFSGQKKPPLEPYLHDFVAECKTLCENGFVYMGRNYTLVLGSLVCDAPARAYLKCVKGHSGYYSCERCEQKGVYHASGRLTLPEMAAPERSHQSFSSQRNESHHNGISPLLSLPIDLVRGVPLDYMHLCCLGVMRMMIRLWLAGPLATRLSAITVQMISERLCRLRSCIPRMFARKPRSLNEFRMWKATEFRQFLLYTGMVALKGAVPLEMYELFLLYSSAMCILLNPKLAREYSCYAKELLSAFVKNFSELFGSQFVVYNVHNLVHLADDAETYGALDSISCFPFENYLNQLKKCVRRPNAPTVQIMRRIAEKKAFQKIRLPGTPGIFHLKKEHSSGPVPISLDVGQQFRQLEGPIFISTAASDNGVLIDGLHVAVVRNIVKNNNVVYLVVQRFEKQDPFYTYPFDSTKLGIFKVSKQKPALDAVVMHSSTNIQKCILADVNDRTFVSVPVLHNHLD